MPLDDPQRRVGETTARGLGWDHQKRRAALLNCLIEGEPCWWCAQPMFRWQNLAADHSIPRARGGRVADRLLHSRCNTERGDGSKDNERPALAIKLRTMVRTSRNW